MFSPKIKMHDAANWSIVISLWVYQTLVQPQRASFSGVSSWVAVACGVIERSTVFGVFGIVLLLANVVSIVCLGLDGQSVIIMALNLL